MKTAVLIMAISYLLFGFVFPMYRIWKRTGVNPISLSKKKSTYHLINSLFKFIVFLIGLNIFSYLFFDSLYRFTGPFTSIKRPFLAQFIGLSLTILSLLIIIIAQNTMSNSWRIGIDEKAKTPLITTGIFIYSRNPIFLGVQICLLGLFLITPNLLMLILLILGISCIHIQVKFEEDHLRKVHLSKYEEYKKKVSRWI